MLESGSEFISESRAEIMSESRAEFMSNSESKAIRIDDSVIHEMQDGMETAYIDKRKASNQVYQPKFVSNNYAEGKKVVASIDDELKKCDEFRISVAFITMSGIEPLLQTLKELERNGVPGKILTTNYLTFSEPAALKKLQGLSNITLKMYDADKPGNGFHTKGYIFTESCGRDSKNSGSWSGSSDRNGTAASDENGPETAGRIGNGTSGGLGFDVSGRQEIYRIIIGSSNMTGAALTINREWNTKIISTEQGEMAQEILAEFDGLWKSEQSLDFDDFYDEYKIRYDIAKKQRKAAKLDMAEEGIASIAKYRLQPNSMQVGFISGLKKIIGDGKDRALLISATGTGKTYASAFAMRELGYKRVLFLVHRGQLARQTKKSYENVFDKSVSMGLVGDGYDEYDKDYVFAMIQTLNRDEHLYHYRPDEFDCIVLDEAHHSSADTYQKVMNYFKPKLFLGMTATPDKRDDDIEGRNIYEIFGYQIAYEIRLQQAMEDDLLCPFHYFGISDISMVSDREIKEKKMAPDNFNQLVGDERVRHIIEQAKYYGYSGDRVKGLIFCSRIDESKELSRKFNELGYRTIALNGDSSEQERTDAFERLAMDEPEDAMDGPEKIGVGPDEIMMPRAAGVGPDDMKMPRAADTVNKTPLDYIFSVDILNEGVDIVEINQVIMLRPTESPIVFIQQLGRGLRKANGKEFVVILDFIGNYTNNFMIPIALSGDRTYNADTIRKYVISGNNTIPGASTIHFDEVARNKIFESIDKIRGMKSIIRNSYVSLKNRLGRVPYLLDFYENGEIDPLVIIREYKTYQTLLEAEESDAYIGKITAEEKTILEYLSKTVLSGIRPYELEILEKLMNGDEIPEDEVKTEFVTKYGYDIDMQSFENAISVLQGHFTSKKEEYEKYCHIDILQNDSGGMLRRLTSFKDKLENKEFYKQVDDIVKVGLRRFHDRYDKRGGNGTYDTINESGIENHVENRPDPFVLYEKYTRRDVCLLMNNERDISSTMYGMKRIDDDVFIFVTYNKEATTDDGKNYVEGKPDYADTFEDNSIFHWDSQMGKGVESSYVKDVCDAKRKHLFVKKSDAEQSFYYMGTFDIMNVEAARKKNNKGKEEDIAEIEMKMRRPVREDLLRYLQSDISESEEVKAG